MSCLLYYPYGHGEIGVGNVVTDNYSTLTPPSGWNIAGDMGSALWAPNQPLAATTYGLAIGASPS